MRIATLCLKVGTKPGGLLCGLLAILSVWTFAGEPARAAEEHDLTLTLSGSALDEVVLEEPITLEGLARALAFLTNRSLPADSVLPMTPDWERAVWSTAAQIEVKWETVSPSSGSSLTILFLPMTNMDTRPRYLPHWTQAEIQAEQEHGWHYDDRHRHGNISAVGLDNAGRRFPVVAFDCGESAVMPSARRDCQLVWDLPPGIELTTIELELPMRLYYEVGREVSASAGSTARAAEEHDLTLTLSGSALDEIAMKEPITLERLARTLMLMTQRPMPFNSILHLIPRFELAEWEAVTQAESDEVFSDYDDFPSRGALPFWMMLPISNRGTMPVALPEWYFGNTWDNRENVLSIHAIALDAFGRRFPVVAFDCGKRLVMPGTSRDCVLLWEIPSNTEVTTVELELPARIYHDVE